MFDLDKWQEILGTMRRNKLRTFLTAFGVFWGIFMLVLLLGAGKGMENGIWKEFGGGAMNSLFVSAGKTSLPWQGLKPGREIKFTNDDMEAIRRQVDGVELLASRNRLFGEYTIINGSKNGSYQVFGANAEFFQLNGEKLVAGRLLNPLDGMEQRKVMLLGEKVRKVLFGDSSGLGKFVRVKGVFFKVVGVFTTTQNNGRNEERAFVPFTTFQTVFNQYNQVQRIGISSRKGTPVKELEDQVRVLLARRHQFDPADKQALELDNNEEEVQRFEGLFSGIKLFVSVIGVLTLVAGVVGVSNIMLIIVQERTREIGVRKALGATPWSIISMIVQESVVITSLSGYLGLLAGVALLDAVRYALEKAGGTTSYFDHPEVNFGVAVSATLLLVVSGAVAGLIPAMKAANVKPIEALRAE
ncbi:putative ABC transport system permease protein [Hymenobacter daecheongensis DSM 21074]|uniref:Putative ABC transport system permease protein n=1 Tax=Hymenobacter daecheongensis DSM 21074 TaxID=1121955 RepID=A0A1M6J9C6_9BACT|nr:ABC transporter permease [Hymenobacter daecheongensis]SHJ43308.1 putative ABC transport system permease protein [Hymenobacter daecheongensis DSM 21074]